MIVSPTVARKFGVSEVVCLFLQQLPVSLVLLSFKWCDFFPNSCTSVWSWCRSSGVIVSPTVARQSGGGVAQVVWLFLQQLPVSLVLVSLKWWENYVPRQKKNSSLTSVSARLFQFKKQLHQYRTKMNTVLSLWNIVFTLCTLWLVQRVETGSVTWNVFTLPDSDETSLFTFEMSVLVTQVCYRCVPESNVF